MQFTNKKKNGHPVLLLTETELEQLYWALGALRTERDCAGTHALERLGGNDGEAAFESLCDKVSEWTETIYP